MWLAPNGYAAVFLIWGGHYVYVKIFASGKEIPLTLTLCVLFGLGMLTWWVYSAPETMSTLEDLFRQNFSEDYWAQSDQVSADYVESVVPFWEHLCNNLAYVLFWIVSFIGCLAAFSRRFGGSRAFAIAVAGLVVLSIGFLGENLDLGVIPGRWQFMSVFLLAIPAGHALQLCCESVRRRLRRSILLCCVIAILAFLSVAGRVANIDNPIIAVNTTVRYAFKASETQAQNTILTLWDRQVATDSYYYRTGYDDIPGYELGDSLLARDFAEHRNNMFVLRRVLAEEAFHFPGIFKLDYDPLLDIEGDGFSQLYDCGTVSVFSWVT
jgi:hypothetical protein